MSLISLLFVSFFTSFFIPSCLPCFISFVFLSFFLFLFLFLFICFSLSLSFSVFLPLSLCFCPAYLAVPFLCFVCLTFFLCFSVLFHGLFLFLYFFPWPKMPRLQLHPGFFRGRLGHQLGTRGTRTGPLMYNFSCSAAAVQRCRATASVGESTAARSLESLDFST